MILSYIVKLNNLNKFNFTHIAQSTELLQSTHY